MALAPTQLPDDGALSIGPRVRALREAGGLSLRDLAERSGVSAPMLSAGRAGGDEPDARRSPRGSRRASSCGSRSCCASTRAAACSSCAPASAARVASARSGHRFEVLTPPLPGQRAELSRQPEPGAQTGGPGDAPMHEPGSREIALIEAGAVVLVIDGERHELATGDIVTFDADLPHHFENPGGEAATRRRQRRATAQLTGHDR